MRAAVPGEVITPPSWDEQLRATQQLTAHVPFLDTCLQIVLVLLFVVLIFFYGGYRSPFPSPPSSFLAASGLLWLWGNGRAKKHATAFQQVKRGGSHTTTTNENRTERDNVDITESRISTKKHVDEEKKELDNNRRWKRNGPHTRWKWKWAKKRDAISLAKFLHRCLQLPPSLPQHHFEPLKMRGGAPTQPHVRAAIHHRDNSSREHWMWGGASVASLFTQLSSSIIPWTFSPCLFWIVYWPTKKGHLTLDWADLITEEICN